MFVYTYDSSDLPVDSRILLTLFHFVYILPDVGCQDFLEILGDSALSLHPLLSEKHKIQSLTHSMLGNFSCFFVVC